MDAPDVSTLAGPRSITVPGLEIVVERRGRTAWVTLLGELDPHGSRYLEALGAEAMDGGGVTHFVVHGAAVSHVGSSGLAALIELGRVASTQAIHMRVEAPSPALGRLLRLAGMERMLADGALESP